MDGEKIQSAEVVPLVVPIERAKKASIPVVSDECRECRKRLERLTRFIYMAADIADEFDH